MPRRCARYLATSVHIALTIRVSGRRKNQKPIQAETETGYMLAYREFESPLSANKGVIVMPPLQMEEGLVSLLWVQDQKKKITRFVEA